MATYTVTTGNWNSAAFWSSINQTTPGHTLDFSALPAGYTVNFDSSTGTITLSDGATTFTVGEAGVGGTSANLGGSTDLDSFTIVTGSAGNDTLEGSDGADTLEGGAGADNLAGGDGDDSLDGGAQHDTLDGGEGDDTITGGTGNDVFYGGSGNDSLIGGAADDTFYGDRINIDPADYPSGGRSAVTLTVTNSADAAVTLWWIDGAGALTQYATINPGQTISQPTFDQHNWIIRDTNGNNLHLIEAGTGWTVDYGADGLNDTVVAGDNWNYIYTEYGDDSVIGGASRDWVEGGSGDDSISGNAGNDDLEGGTGNDTLDGGTGADTIDGGADADTFNLANGFGNDVITGGEGTSGPGGSDSDTIDAGAVTTNLNVTFSGDEFGSITGGGDTITFSQIENVFTGSGDDVLNASAGSDGYGLFGNDGADTITGSSGADYIEGGDDDDLIVIEDGFGADTIFGGEGGTDSDTVNLSALTGAVGIGYTGNEAGTITGGGDTITFSQIESLILTDQNDTVDATSDSVGVDILAGGGADEIYGGSGDDDVGAGAGNDTVFAGDGNDDVYGDTGDDSIIGGAGEDTLYGADGADTLGGGSGDDLIFGGDGDDYIAESNTNSGNDTLDGGLGNDIIYTGSGNDQVIGADGNDTVYVTGGLNTVYAGSGHDRITTSGASDASQIYAGTGDDLVSTYDGNNNNDTVHGDTGNDEIYTYDGNDVVSGGADSDTIDAGTGHDTVDGGDGADLIQAQDGDDRVIGGAGSDTIDGGSGDDRITGGTDDDSITGGAGDDTFVYGVGDGADTITDFNTGNSGALGDGDTTNNDFIDLGAFYDNLNELRADFDDDGVLNQSNATTRGGDLVDYSDNSQMGPGDSLTFHGASRDSFTADNTAVVCFATGTMILTPRGEVPVESLRPGDMVITQDNGSKPVLMSASRALQPAELLAAPHLKPVLIQSGAFGQSRELIVSPQHGMLLMQGGTPVLVRAKHLAELDGGGVRYMIGCRRVTYCHLLFEQHEIIFSNGLPSESFYPGPEARASLTPDARTELDTLFPELAAYASLYHAQSVYGGAACNYSRRGDLPEHISTYQPAA